MHQDIGRAEPEGGACGQQQQDGGDALRTRSPVREALDYARIERALRFVMENFEAQPSLEDIADAAALSPFHFQRLFTRWVGVSPKRFLGYLTLEHAKLALERGAGVLEASMDAGLSAPSRLHDLFVNFEAVTPGQHRSGGDGLEIVHGMHAGPLGDFVVAATDRGVCALEFVGSGGPEAALAAVSSRFPGATLRHRPKDTERLCRSLFDDPGDEPRRALQLWCRGTNFQVRVWAALLSIPPGALATYSDVARAIGSPSSARAVGNAVAANPIAVLIPCHRVIRATGLFGTGYRWGTERKLALIGREQARSEVTPGAGAHAGLNGW